MIKYKGMFARKTPSEDRVILVDTSDKAIGTMDKVEAHRGKGTRHRAISIFLFNNRGEMLLQQRSKKKIVGALQWANTCCGNVRPGETRKECALRRLREELGITDAVIKPLYTFEYHIPCNVGFSEWEVDRVYTGTHNGKMRLNPDEVERVAWRKPNEILQEIDKRDMKYAPWFVIMMRSGFFGK